MKISRRTLLPMTVMLVAVLGLTACGSDAKSSTNTDSNSTKATSSSSTAPSADVVVKGVQVGDLGTILVDASGRTVYALTKDGANVPCTGDCLAAWPPVMLPTGSDTPTGGDGVSGLTAVTVTDGKQVASDGLPLYTFSGDPAAGVANGEGLSSFGGVWHVVKVGGGAATSETSSTSSDDSNGYGY